MTVMTKKKQTERYFLETARKASAFFPKGAVKEQESPDFVLQTEHEVIGIEVREIFRPKGTAEFPLQEAESFHEQVMDRAEKLYETRSSPEVDVLAYFTIDCTRRKLEQTAKSIADFVANSYQVGETRTFDRHDDRFPDGISVIRIAPPLPESSRAWRCLKHGGPMKLEKKVLAEEIAEKEKLLPCYRSAAGQVWLLLVVRAFPITTFWVPREINTWKFTFGFDKILLFIQSDFKVIEIGRAQ